MGDPPAISKDRQKKEIWYSPDGGTRYPLMISTWFSSDWEDRAVEAAEDYHGNHDGWEATWPLVLELFETEEGPAVARFEMEREYEPQFHAWKLEPQS